MLVRSDLFFQVTASLLLTALLGCTGCRQDDPIEKHRVEKSRSGLEALQNDAANNDSSIPAPETPQLATDRMVVAIYNLDDATWFFKLSGTIAQVTQTESEWQSFFQSVQFKDGKPEWELPSAWNVGNDRPMRFATLVIGDLTPPLEMAISSLGPGQDLVLNVNRWRGQMGLAPIQDSELSQNTSPLAFSAQSSPVESAILFDATGGSAGSMMPPFAGSSAGGSSGASMRPAFPDNNQTAQPTTESAQKSAIKFDIPAGWEAGPTSSMVPVRLQKNDDGKMVQISVVPLPAAANEWTPNTKRWANEIEMSDLTAAELETLTSVITVDGIDGQMLKLISTDENKPKATIAAMVKQNETAWFLKLTGDKVVVGNSEADFETFLDSIKFP